SSSLRFGWGRPSSSTTLKSRMKPSSLRTRAMATLVLEAGMSTASCREEAALRMRVSISAIGSLTLITLPLWRLRWHLPAGLGDAGQKPPMRVFAETDAAHGEAPDVGFRAPTNAAAVVLPGRVLRRALRLFDEGLFRHCGLLVLTEGHAHELEQ